MYMIQALQDTVIQDGKILWSMKTMMILKALNNSDGILSSTQRLILDFTTRELEMIQHGPHADGTLLMSQFQSS